MTIERRRSTIDGIEIAWSHRGAGEGTAPIVVLHGLGSSSRELLCLADCPHLQRHSLVFLDLPGFGDSEGPDRWTYAMEDQADLVASLLREMGSPPVVLIGHSMGGSIAIALATRHPGLVARLIVAEPKLDPGSGALSGHIARQPKDRFVRRGYAALLYQTSREADRGSAVAARFLVTLRKAFPIALHRSAVSLRAARSPTFREQLEGLMVPRTVIWGATTPPLDPPLTNPAIVHETIANAGHVMMVENPDGFAAAIRRGLERHAFP